MGHDQWFSSMPSQLTKRFAGRENAAGWIAAAVALISVVVLDRRGMRSTLNNVLGILASVCVFGAIALFANRDTPHFWIKLTLILSVSVVLMLCTQDREAWDTFFTVLAALSTLIALVLPTAYHTLPNWWLYFVVCLAVAALLVAVTKKRREACIGIASIAMLRLMFFVVTYFTR